MPSLAARVGLVLALVSLAGLSVSCEEDLESTPRDVDRSDIPPTPEGAWLSTPWDITAVEDLDEQGLIEIPPRGRIRLFHGLGHRPATVNAYVGFSVDAIRTMPASGNAAEIWDVREDFVEIRNGSGGSFFYRFVLR